MGQGQGGMHGSLESRGHERRLGDQEAMHVRGSSQTSAAQQRQQLAGGGTRPHVRSTRRTQQRQQGSGGSGGRTAEAAPTRLLDPGALARGANVVE